MAEEGSTEARLPRDQALQVFIGVISCYHHASYLPSSPGICSCAGGVCRHGTLPSLDSRKHRWIYISSIYSQSIYSWPFRVSYYITWSGVLVYSVGQTTFSRPSKSLYTVTSKNRCWPFLKKTLSNNFANLTPLLLWPSVSGMSVLIYFWCPEVFLPTMTLLLSSIYSFYLKKRLK